MKNGFKTLVVLCLMLCFQAVSALAAETARVEVSSAQASPGEEVSLTVSIADNPGFAGYDMRVDYDTGVMELTGFTLARVAGALSSAAPETGMATFASLDSFVDDGVIATLTFRIRDDAKPGAVSVGIAEADFFNIDENAIPVESVYGTLTISAGETVTQPDDPAETADPAEQKAAEEGNTPTPAPQQTISPKENEAAAHVSEGAALPDALVNAGLDPARAVVYEISSDADGNPAVGFVEVTVPYPAGSDGVVYRAYMIDADGGVEELPLTEDANGLTVVTDAENSFSISWLTPEEDDAARMAERADDSEAEAPSSLGAAVWIAAAVVVALGVAAAVLLLRRKRGK